MAARCAARQCALLRRFNSISSLHGPSTAITPISTFSQWPLQRRSLAAAATRKPSPSYSDVFTLSEIPISSFEGVISRNGDSFKQLSPEGYYAVAQRFSQAIARGASPWAVSFTDKDNAVSAEVLHNVACIMRQIHGPRSADAFATALWASASEMGFRPATLSLARQLVHSGAFGRTPQLRRVEARFKGLVSAGKDPDALTLEGELLFRQNKLDVAAAMLKRALKMSEAFEWRPYCELCLGKVYLKMNKVDEAREILERLADEGLVEADIELGQMLGAEAEQRIYTAACNGRRDMFTRLSELELEKGGPGKSDRERRLWAMEWSKLADARVEY